MNQKVVTFGEIMLRLSPPASERFFQSPELHATFGGAEANVAVSLAHFGFDSLFVTRLPEHAIGDAAVRALRAEGVRTDSIQRGGERMGSYFAEKGASQRASVVIYDRAQSAFATLHPPELDWDGIMAQASWFHTSGITPALSDNARVAVTQALAAARRAGATTSFDLNFRSKLWSRAAAQTVIPPLLSNVDLLVANEDDLQATLGMEIPGGANQGHLQVSDYAPAMRHVTKRFGLRWVAVSLRESTSASENDWRALFYEAATDTLLESRSYRLQIVDRIGAGDAFCAGLIRSLLAGCTLAEILEFAAAAGALKHSIPGDFNRVSAVEVERLAAGDGSGRVQR